MCVCVCDFIMGLHVYAYVSVCLCVSCVCVIDVCVYVCIMYSMCVCVRGKCSDLVEHCNTPARMTGFVPPIDSFAIVVAYFALAAFIRFELLPVQFASP